MLTYTTGLCVAKFAPTYELESLVHQHEVKVSQHE